jgi:hypothetical protein
MTKDHVKWIVLIALVLLVAWYIRRQHAVNTTPAPNANGIS